MDRGQPDLSAGDELKAAAAQAARVIEVQATPIPPGEEPGARAAGADDLSWDVIAQFAVDVGLAFAAQRDPIWAPKPGESRELARAVSAVFAKYLPDALTRFGPEAMLALAAVGYAMPRLAEQSERRAKKRKAADDLGQQPAPQSHEDRAA